MSMTVQNIIDDARPKLGDSISPYQWLDAHFYTPINDGVREIGTRNPEALCVSSVAIAFPSDVTAVGDTVAIIDEFRNQLVELVVAQLFSEDQERQRQIVPPAGEETP